MHRHRCGEVGVHLVDHATLRVGERKRQGLQERLLHRAAHVVLQARVVALERFFATDEHQLHAQQFVERQSLAGPFFVDDAFRKVNGAQRGVARHEPKSLEQRGR